MGLMYSKKKQNSSARNSFGTGFKLKKRMDSLIDGEGGARGEEEREREIKVRERGLGW